VARALLPPKESAQARPVGPDAILPGIVTQSHFAPELVESTCPTDAAGVSG
jgi:hypothetical protein